jgi:hypothetical protein
VFFKKREKTKNLIKINFFPETIFTIVMTISTNKLRLRKGQSENCPFFLLKKSLLITLLFIANYVVLKAIDGQ